MYYAENGDAKRVDVQEFRSEEYFLFSAQLQQTEREIIRIEHHPQQIETRARDEYKTCQEHIMKYAKENNRFLLRDLFQPFQE